MDYGVVIVHHMIKVDLMLVVAIRSSTIATVAADAVHVVRAVVIFTGRHVRATVVMCVRGMLVAG